MTILPIWALYGLRMPYPYGICHMHTILNLHYKCIQKLQEKRQNIMSHRPIATGVVANEGILIQIKVMSSHALEQQYTGALVDLRLRY